MLNNIFNHQQLVATIEDRLDYKVNNVDIFVQAFTRSSYVHENESCYDNEVLEFIGDTILSSVVVNKLYEDYMTRTSIGLASKFDEGMLTKIKASLVNKHYLAERMEELGLAKYLRMGVGDIMLHIDETASVKEDLFESIVAAIYIDSNRDMDVTRKVVEQMLDINTFLINEYFEEEHNFVGDVQEWCQQHGYAIPEYDIIEDEGGFNATCKVREINAIAVGLGKNKKTAKNNAAKNIYYENNMSIQPMSNIVYNRDNAINVLQEIAQKNGEPLPQYEFVEEKIFEDNSHEFTCKCFFRSWFIEGSGSNKKDAKKDAAFNMLETMKWTMC